MKIRQLITTFAIAAGLASAATAGTTKSWTKLCTDIAYQAEKDAGVTTKDKNQSFFAFEADMAEDSLTGAQLFKYGSSNSNYVMVKTTDEGFYEIEIWRNGKDTLTQVSTTAATVGKHIFALKVRRGASDASQLLCAILYMNGTEIAKIVHGQDGRDESLVYAGNPMANYTVG